MGMREQIVGMGRREEQMENVLFGGVKTVNRTVKRTSIHTPNATVRRKRAMERRVLYSAFSIAISGLVAVRTRLPSPLAHATILFCSFFL